MVTSKTKNLGLEPDILLTNKKKIKREKLYK